MKLHYAIVLGLCCLFTGCESTANTSASDDAEWKEQQKKIREQNNAYDRQLMRGEEQMDVTDKYNQHAAAIQDKAVEQNQRFDKILDKWDEQAKRMDAVLDKMEAEHGLNE